MIAHIDADCFFVACEQLKHPVLRGQEVCVLSSQDACVVSKSYEAKAVHLTDGAETLVLENVPDELRVRCCGLSREEADADLDRRLHARRDVQPLAVRR